MTDDASPSFRAQLVDQLPALRAFARTLARDASQADDLTQEAMLKAWANRHRYQEGTNLRAWLFTILRNTFYSEFRKRRREVADVDGEHAARLTTRPSQEHAMALREFETALARLPVEQREALVLVGAAGMAYDEAAQVIGVAVGTVKSRVSRARAALSAILDVNDAGDLVSDRALDAALRGPPDHAA
ncbi:MAG: sigma-70 family RNA polymerase sigma factor [Pseudomonadota bacterium]